MEAFGGSSVLNVILIGVPGHPRLFLKGNPRVNFLAIFQPAFVGSGTFQVIPIRRVRRRLLNERSGSVANGREFLCFLSFIRGFRHHVHEAVSFGSVFYFDLVLLRRFNGLFFLVQGYASSGPLRVCFVGFVIVARAYVILRCFVGLFAICVSHSSRSRHVVISGSLFRIWQVRPEEASTAGAGHFCITEWTGYCQLRRVYFRAAIFGVFGLIFCSHYFFCGSS